VDGDDELSHGSAAALPTDEELGVTGVDAVPGLPWAFVRPYLIVPLDRRIGAAAGGKLRQAGPLPLSAITRRAA
jgi:hypothetical protein